MPPSTGKLKTRSGETTKLKDLLDTAVILAEALMLSKFQVGRQTATPFRSESEP